MLVQQKPATDLTADNSLPAFSRQRQQIFMLFSFEWRTSYLYLYLIFIVFITSLFTYTILTCKFLYLPSSISPFQDLKINVRIKKRFKLELQLLPLSVFLCISYNLPSAGRKHSRFLEYLISVVCNIIIIMYKRQTRTTASSEHK